MRPGGRWYGGGSILRPAIGWRAMTEQEKRTLAAAVLRAVADFEQNGGDLVGSLAPLVDAARGDPLPGTPAALIPSGKVDEATRKRAAMDYVRAKGRITSGQLAAMTACHPETARLALVDLVGRGVLVKRGDTKATYYRAGPAFPGAK